MNYSLSLSLGRAKIGALDPDAAAYYSFDATDAATITATGGSPNLITEWANSASGAEALTLSLAQATSNDQPQWDGTKLTFADTSDHLDFSTATATPGWVVVGTSLGTFTYRKNINLWAELALLGRSTAFRQTGELYGIMLLPPDASAALIAAARSKMIGRGAGDGLVGVTMANYFRDRSDMVEFGLLDTSAGTNFSNAWQSCVSLTSFPLLDTSAGTNFVAAWQSCNSLTSFPLLDTSAGTNFNFAWSNCNKLTSFPLLNTSAGTNFSAAWDNCTSLTSFPLLNTSAGTNFGNAWRSCTSLTSFPLLDTSAGTNFNFAWFNCNSLTSFPLLDTSAGTNFSNAWQNCTSLTSFPLLDTSAGTNFERAWLNCNKLTSFPLLDTSAGTNFSFAWLSCASLTSFPANFFDSWNPTSIANAVFNETWRNCPLLTSASVENILTSLDTSGKYGTNTGLVGGTILADNTIDITYDNSGLTLPTGAAIANLKSRNWQININGVLQ